MNPRLTIIGLLAVSFFFGWLIAGALRGLSHFIPDDPRFPPFQRQVGLLDPPETLLVEVELPGTATTCEP